MIQKVSLDIKTKMKALHNCMYNISVGYGNDLKLISYKSVSPDFAGVNFHII